jgi:hypothetical protein
LKAALAGQQQGHARIVLYVGYLSTFLTSTSTDGRALRLRQYN